MSDTRSILDGILKGAVDASGGVPGVVAMATDRNKNIYEGAFGVRRKGDSAPIGNDSVFAIFSTTKAITGVALMQLVEEGALSLDDEAGKYVPEIDAIEILEGFNAAGEPILRKAKTKITVGQLLLHTAGFGYEFFSNGDLEYRTAKGTPSLITNTFSGIRSVRLFEAGEKWNYGTNIDWAGLVVEKLRGKRLGEVIKERIFDPLGMHDSAFSMNDSMASRFVAMHQRDADGKLVATDFQLPRVSEMDMGGHGIHATVADYMKFIRLFLNDGTVNGKTILKSKTVDFMLKNGLPNNIKSGGWIASIPSLTNAGEFFPAVTKGWGYTFQINEEDAPTGRPAGSAAWAGLANLYYWIDRKNGIGGYWGTQIFPFLDPASYHGFVEFESAVYALHRQNKFK